MDESGDGGWSGRVSGLKSRRCECRESTASCVCVCVRDCLAVRPCVFRVKLDETYKDGRAIATA